MENSSEGSLPLPSQGTSIGQEQPEPFDIFFHDDQDLERFFSITPLTSRSPLWSSLWSLRWKQELIVPLTDADCREFFHHALTHVQVNEPHAFHALQNHAENPLHRPEVDAEEWFISALSSFQLPKETKEKVERSVANYIVHGFDYNYSPYSPAAAEKDVLAATDGKDRRNLEKQWDADISGWAGGHKKAYGNLIDPRRRAFHGIISEAVYKRINNLKSAQLATFYKKMKNEAQEQLTSWLMLVKYPQYDN